MSSPAAGARPAPARPPSPPSLRDRLARRPLGPRLWVGLVLLALYLAAALSALVVFRHSLFQLSVTPSWIPPPAILAPIRGPSLAHPFGILPGLGVDLFSALWQATPFDLAIVSSILALDALLGWLLGTLAGMHEGGLLDSLVTFVGDSLGSIPSFFLVIAVFAGLATVAPSDSDRLPSGLLCGLLLCPPTARSTRDRARLVAREPFLEASRAAGARPSQRNFLHLLPNSLSPLLAQIPIDIAPIFFVLTVFPWFWDCGSGPHANTGVFWLVAGLPPYSPLPSATFPEWGNILAVGTCEGLPYVTGANYWWMYLFPLLAIVGLGVAVALLCDGVDQRLTERVT